MATEKQISNLVINKVESQAVYDHMASNNLVNEDELYLIENTGDDSGGGVFFGTCMTAASTNEKVVTTQQGNFKLEVGATVYVQFNTASTSTATTLNIDGTGAIAVQTSATNVLMANQIAPKSVVGFVYDGTVYRMLDGAIATTTYYGVTKLSSAVNSISTATAATSSAVKKAYDLAAAALPLDGGTMTGILTLFDMPTQYFHAVPKKYVDHYILTIADALEKAGIPVSGLDELGGGAIGGGGGNVTPAE
jgi:hypothetical protein